MKYINTLLATDNTLAPLIARVTLATVMFPHGAQKLFGWFGGYGFTGTMNFFTESLGIPALVAFLVIIAESLGAIALFFGFLSRLTAIGIGITMTGAMFMVTLPNGFFMNWYGNQAGEGYEYHLLTIGLALIGTLSGGGKLSVDALFSQK